MTRNRCVGAVLVALAAALLSTACSTLPTSGSVQTRPDAPVGPDDSAPYFVPAGPVAGADRDTVVRGFLLAVQANPQSTSVARSFLSDRTRNTWKPDHGTVVYATSTLESSGSQVQARLSGAHRLDARGRWLGGTAAVPVTLPFRMVRENGEWRIDNPPRMLPIPTSYFRSLYVPYTLAFFDRTGEVLVPTRVYLPRGEQVASNLVRSMLAGPGGHLARSTRNAFPPGTSLDLAVVVDASGIAEVPLNPEVRLLSPPDLYRAVVQLTWALRQVQGITGLRVTIDGVALPLVNGRTDVGLDEGREFDPITADGLDAVGVVEGRIVYLRAGISTPVAGPLGAKGFAMRSVARSVSRGQFAAVAANGRRVFVAPGSGATEPGRVRTAIDGASNLLPPVYDRFGGLWVVDATPSGAVVHLVTGSTDRIVRVPGISGRRISSFTVTRDGARFVAGLPNAPAVLVSDLVRDENGRVGRTTPAAITRIEGPAKGPVLDVAQATSTAVSVLMRSASDDFEIAIVEVDGSPGDPDVPDWDPLPERVTTLLDGPDPDLKLQALTPNGRLYELTANGRWVRAFTGVRAAAYPQ